MSSLAEFCQDTNEMSAISEVVLYPYTNVDQTNISQKLIVIAGEEKIQQFMKYRYIVTKREDLKYFKETKVDQQGKS